MNLSDAQFNGRRREMIDKMFNELYAENTENNEELNVLDRIKRLEDSVASLMAKVQEIERMVSKPQFDDEYIRRLIDESIRNHISSDHNANGLPEMSQSNLQMLRYEIMETLRQEFNMFLRQKVERGNLYIGFNDIDSYY